MYAIRSMRNVCANVEHAWLVGRVGGLCLGVLSSASPQTRKLDHAHSFVACAPFNWVEEHN